MGDAIKLAFFANRLEAPGPRSALLNSVTLIKHLEDLC